MVCPSISWSDSTLGNITCYFTRREELGGGLVRHRDGQLAVRVPRHGFGSSGNIGPIYGSYHRSAARPMYCLARFHCSNSHLLQKVQRIGFSLLLLTTHKQMTIFLSVNRVAFNSLPVSLDN
ncbi:hypothetical protein ACQJBY_048729 [Aegilops geniculata]